MHISHIFCYVSVFSGVILQGLALRAVIRIISELPENRTRKQWRVLLLLIMLFIPGYLIYLFILLPKIGHASYFISFFFFLGALFVYMVCLLTLHSVHALKKIPVLETENVTDLLMNIYNRRFLESRLQEEFERAKRYALPLSLLLLDLDHFKKVNDIHGHQNGDLVLKNLGKIIRQTIRNTDMPVRFGGEEIVVLMPNTQLLNAHVLAERLRKRVAAFSFIIDGQNLETDEINCTISVGLTEMTKKTSDAEDLLRLADKALYRAKSEGRNRVVSTLN